MSKVAKKDTDLTKGTVTFTFSNGGVVVAGVGKLSKDIQAHLMLHGLAQKVGDSYAGAENADEAQKFATETLADLEKGSWTTRAASSGPKISLLAEAVARLRKVTIDKATEVITGLNATDEGKETVKKLRAHPAVKAAMTAISAERAAAKLKEATKAGTADLGDLLTA